VVLCPRPSLFASPPPAARALFTCTGRLSMTSTRPGPRRAIHGRSFRLASAGALLAAGAVGLALLGRAPGPARAGNGEAGPAPLAASVPAEAPAAAPPEAAQVPNAAPADPAAVREARARAAAAPTITRLVPSRGRFLVTRAIELQASQLAACFPPRAGAATPVRAASRRSLVAAASRGVLRLELEPQLGEIWILDATVEAQGTGTEAELACARRALTGLALNVPASTPGERVAMLYPLP
jgi:hypothetical protein